MSAGRRVGRKGPSKNQSKDQSEGSAREDALLWSRVADTVKPLPGKSAPIPPEPAAGTPKPASKHLPQGPGKTDQKLSQTMDAEPLAPGYQSMAAQDLARLAKGRTAPGRKVDLHGHTLEGAYRHLEDAVRAAYDKGERRLLVITGKGGPGGSTGADTPRGALKRDVPRWLESQAFQRYVHSVAPAYGRHGGEGALYVQLRRKG